MIRVAVVEDMVVLREKMCDLLNRQSDMQCVLQAGSLNEFFNLCSALSSNPDILLLDISLGEENSLDYLQEITEVFPHTKTIILTGHDDPDILMEAFQNGAASFALKNNPPSQLLQIIHITYEGGAYLEPRLSKPVVQSLAFANTSKLPDKATEHNLNLREAQIMRGLVDGKSYEEIGRLYNIGINTVRAYVKSLYRKLDVHSKIQLINKMKTSG